MKPDIVTKLTVAIGATGLVIGRSWPHMNLACMPHATHPSPSTLRPSCAGLASVAADTS
jgi:hypothetical protein